MRWSVEGRTCVVTGASSGIGLETARGLAARGARVLMVCRDRGRGEAARDDVATTTGRRPELLLADLSAQREVRALADGILGASDDLGVLVHNAGLTLGRRVVTEDGREATIAVNHLAPFLLTRMLWERLVASAPARVVTVASDAHRRGRLDLDDLDGERGWSPWGAYCQSKLANILFTRELARRLEGTGVVASCMHPGVVRTGFGREGAWWTRLFFAVAGRLLLTPEQGADTVVWLATAPEATAADGGYFVRRRRVRPSRAARDDRAARRLWEVSERLCAVRP